MALRSKSDSKMKTYLKDAQDIWSKSEENAKIIQGASAVPNGNYLGKVETQLVESSKGSPMIKWAFAICEGEYEGITMYSNTVLDNEWGAGTARLWIELMGYEVPEEAEALEEMMEEISKENPTVEFSARKKDDSDFHNIRILKTVEGETKTKTEKKGEDESTIDLDELNRAELRKLIKDNELEIHFTKSMSDDDIRAAIEKASGGDEGGTGEDEAELLESLKVFCENNDVKLKGVDEKDVDAMKETISENTYKKEELSEDEIEFLEELGMGKLIKEAKAKKKPFRLKRKK